MIDNKNNTSNNKNTNNDYYKITICAPDGTEEVYKTNLAFLICDTGEKLEASQLCRNGLLWDIFQLVRMGQKAILEMIPKRHLRMYEVFASSVPVPEDEEEE